LGNIMPVMNKHEIFVSCLADIEGLSVFSNLKKHPLLRAFGELLAACENAIKSPSALCAAWSAFTGAFVCYAQLNEKAHIHSFYRAVASLVITDDNSFTRAAEALRNDSAPMAEIPPLLKTFAASDLGRLMRIATADMAKTGFHVAGALRENGLAEAAKNIEAEARMLWTGESASHANDPNDPAGAIFPPGTDWSEALPRFAAYIAAHGAGELSKGCFFSWKSSNVAHNKMIHLQPVRNADPVRLVDLAGYETQRQTVIANTVSFIEGKIANNLLLHGDRGTGKSATIKAVCREYAERGLRLLEIHKKDLVCLPDVLETLAARHLRFVLFIDDLSFESIDDSFIGLKALLEGGLESRPPNVVIYVTSNRRHLIKERLSDRPSPALATADSDGEVRAFETMQEQFSLADRFGISLLFTAPDQEEYLLIAEHIARQRKILPPVDNTSSAETLTFRQNALRWEKWFNGRSPRTAVQYVDWCAGGAAFPWE
jgi:predicted AAA+ superfamily ATPase